MKVLVLGATGATGRLVVQQLFKRNVKAKIVVRDTIKLPNDIINNNRIECFVGSIYDFEQRQYIDLIKDCDAVVSCLGHNITFKGMFGKPRMLVTNCIKKVCEAIQENKNGKVKIILMSTTANQNRMVNEQYSIKDRFVLSVMGFLLPPHKDNVRAAAYLSHNIGKINSCIEWIAVRPDTLIDEKDVTDYETIRSPKRSPVFDAGKTSRINVAHFMTDLLVNEELWNRWKYKMPVIYNSEI